MYNKNNTNMKRILCYNMLNHKKCSYGNKCMYAHYLSEQKIEDYRYKAYTIIRDSNNLEDLDLKKDIKLLNHLIQLTKVCTLCISGLCLGGYNCRSGAISLKYKICYDDLMYGNCCRNTCQFVHLTQKGLTPYHKQKIKVNKDKKTDIITDSLFNKKFLLQYLSNKPTYYSSDSETEDEHNRTLQYLNTDNNSDDESIFQ